MVPALPDRHKLWQYIYAVIVSYGSISTGMSMGWSSPVLPNLRNVTLSPLDYVLSEQQESWIGSLLLLGGILGPILATPAMVWIGRKLTMLSLCVPLLLGWILTASATALEVIYVGRFFWGIAVGMQFTVVPIYLSEISETAVRGALGSLFLLLLNVGFFAAYAIGPYVSYRNFGIIGSILSAIYAVGLFFVPETPGYFMMKGRNDEAMMSLKTIRGKEESEVREEYDKLKVMTEKLLEDKTKISELWSSRCQLKALLMCSFLAMLIQLSGIDVLLLYMEVLLRKMGAGIPARESTICLGVVQVVSSCVTPVVIDRLGRRLLMYTTSLILTFCLFVIGLYALFDAYKFDFVSSITWLPLLALVIYLIAFNLGVGPVPWVLVGEMFPAKSKPVAAGIASITCWIVGFIWTRYFADIERTLGIYWAYWFLAIACFVGFLFSILMLPETKGKTFEEIQDLLHNTKPRKTENAASPETQ